MRHLYAINTSPDDPAIAEANVDKVWLEDNRSLRTTRAQMFSDIGMREGDTLVLFYLRHLGGSPVADKKWQTIAEARDITIEIFDFDAPPKPMGRPRKYDPDPGMFRKHRQWWLDPLRTEQAKLADISEDYGQKVTRGICNGRFGWPGNEKPIPSDMAAQAGSGEDA